ncbi:MAG TPA: hypothetical protein VHC67_09880 [Gaiellaceae bacterium]|jgi:hypothetical protein|nr:hypothetical protein [Gaiellaceae bacterium]
MLARWTAFSEDWQEDVGSVAVRTDDGLLFFDPPCSSTLARQAAAGGVECIPTARNGEVVSWVPGERAVIVGDVLLGAGARPRPTDDPLRLCPQRRLAGANLEELRESLRPLLGLPVEQVLVSHGAPVTAGGADALAAIL